MYSGSGWSISVHIIRINRDRKLKVCLLNLNEARYKYSNKWHRSKFFDIKKINPYLFKMVIFS